MHRHSHQDSAPQAHRGASRGGGLAMLGVIVPTAYLAFKLFEKQGAKTGAKRTRKFVRDAGPENMQTPPRRWDRVDEQADESFPASDPPGNY